MIKLNDKNRLQKRMQIVLHNYYCLQQMFKVVTINHCTMPNYMFKFVNYILNKYLVLCCKLDFLILRLVPGLLLTHYFLYICST